MASSVCVCCGKSITWQFDICAKCEAHYKAQCAEQEVPYPPEWLRLLANDSQLERRTMERNPCVELSLDDEEIAGAAECNAYGEFLGMMGNPGYVSRMAMSSREPVDIPEEPNTCWNLKKHGPCACRDCEMAWWCGKPDD